MHTEEINIGFTKEELCVLTDMLMPILENTTDESDHYDHTRLAQLSAAVKIALAGDRFDEFELSPLTFFERTQQLKNQLTK